jgi:predicted O-methyltransferase YrrM
VSYHGYAGIARGYLDSVPADRTAHVLEVGVDKGVMFLALAAHLTYRRERFQLIGVDIKVQENVKLGMTCLPPLTAAQKMYLIEENSLDELQKMIEMGLVFDLFLLDGDHNYHTVSKELELMERLTHPNSLVILDDYDGRWSKVDQWYAEEPGYESVVATQRVPTEKRGVKVAVDDFLASRPQWRMVQMMKGEPVVLLRELQYTPKTV